MLASDELLQADPTTVLDGSPAAPGAELQELLQQAFGGPPLAPLQLE